jgi:hypothetical protein
VIIEVTFGLGRFKAQLAETATDLDRPADDHEADHSGCYQPHLGPDGYIDCDGRPL